MALEDIFRALEVDGEEDRRQLFARTEVDVAKIIREAEAEAGKIQQAKTDRIMLQLRGEQTRILNEARLYKKKQIIHAKEMVLTEAIDKAAEQLKRLRSTDDYEPAFKALAVELLEMIEPGAAMTVHVAPDDRVLAEKAFGELGADAAIVADKDYSGGLSIDVNDGKIVYLNCIESRLEKTKRLLRTEISKMLFDEEQAAPAVAGG